MSEHEYEWLMLRAAPFGRGPWGKASASRLMAVLDLLTYPVVRLLIFTVLACAVPLLLIVQMCRVLWWERDEWLPTLKAPFAAVPMPAFARRLLLRRDWSWDANGPHPRVDRVDFDYSWLGCQPDRIVTKRPFDRPGVVTCPNCNEPNNVPPLQADGTHRCGFCGFALPAAKPREP